MQGVVERIYKGANWNYIEDPFDLITWEKLNENFWLDTEYVPSKDTKDWKKFSENEQWLIMRVFAGLTALDTLQSEDGLYQIMRDSKTAQERANYNQIALMESIHAKSYSTIFTTLADPQQIEDVFRWIEENPFLQKKAKMINEIYVNGTSYEKKIASVFLESFCFYSGFYLPLFYAGQTKMVATGEIISAIVRDEAVHGAYIGKKFQSEFALLDEAEQKRVTNWASLLLYNLFDNECKYTEDLYDEFGMTDDVKTFLKYNANNAMYNLGLPKIFSIEKTEVNSVVLNGLSVGTATNDMFTTKGNGYKAGFVEEFEEDDFDYEAIA